MTNADLHVQAFAAAYGICPVTFETLGCRIDAISADGAVIVLRLTDLVTGKAHDWRYPGPEVWRPDPAGDVARTVYVDDVPVEIMGVIDPMTIAAGELAHHLELWRR